MIAEAALPEGTRYVMIELLDSSNSWGQQIGAVAFERLE